MELYLLRHAVAKPRSSKFPDDSRRPLTKAGRQQMRRVAKGIGTLEIPFDRILSSPFVRARETAEIAAGVLKLKKAVRFSENLTPQADFEDLIDELKKNFSRDKNLLLVGHEPHLSHFMSFLLTAGQQISVDLQKGGLSCLTLPKITGPGGATLNWLLTPAQLCRFRR